MGTPRSCGDPGLAFDRRRRPVIHEVFSIRQARRARDAGGEAGGLFGKLVLVR
jgi:hypothetical protein